MVRQAKKSSALSRRRIKRLSPCADGWSSGGLNLIALDRIVLHCIDLLYMAEAETTEKKLLICSDVSFDRLK